MKQIRHLMEEMTAAFLVPIPQTARDERGNVQIPTD